ncbi:hypothetical protein [Streptomyces rishiriensis]|uniref:Uncharacterized protein n=1 Tax=Streptomyces rishiriensis TaxID=68264 RepID=A0ABU0NHM8_STRRH|nr:hypothetical protein [Streptomyces rishiriensis]MDQ0578632.1 hypothetical protein [Streptomyces rishiriensis]
MVRRALFVPLVFAAIVLGVVGVPAKDLSHLLVDGVVVLAADLVLPGLRPGRRRSRLRR